MKIPTAKPSRIKIGPHNSYRLEPAACRTHYGQHRLDRNGIPYCYATKKAEAAWFVVSEWDGKKHGVLEQGDDDWTFTKIVGHEQAPGWLWPQMHGSVDHTIYSLRGSLQSGPTAEAAIARGLGITLATGEKTAAQLDREIAEARAK